MAAENIIFPVTNTERECQNIDFVDPGYRVEKRRISGFKRKLVIYSTEC